MVGFFLLGFANLFLCALVYATCVRCRQVVIIQVIVWETLSIFGL